MRATLDALGETGRTVYVADSFQGFPSPTRSATSAPTTSSPCRPTRCASSFARFGLSEGVELVEGFFEETLPTLADERWAVVRLDGDTYEATRAALDALYPRLAVGGYLIVDDFGAMERDECRRAVEEFRGRHGITEPIEEVDWTCVRWRRESDTPIEVPPQHRPPAARAQARSRTRAGTCRPAASSTSSTRSSQLREQPARAVVAPLDRPRPMIAFGARSPGRTSTARCAEPGIRRAAEPDSAVFDARRGRLDLAELQRAARPRGRARRPRGARARAPGRRADEPRAVRDDPRHAGGPRRRGDRLLGAIGVRSIAWWEGSVTLASFINRYDELGGGDLHSFSWNWDDAPAYARAGEVETLDGFVIVCSPWAVAEHALRRDARRVPRLRPRLLPAGPRGRPQGRHRRLPCDPPPAARDAPRPARVDRCAHPRGREVGRADARDRARRSGTWRERALRAEAERDAARALARTTAREIEARSAMLGTRLAETRTSISWRLTAPLRLFRRPRPR